MWCLTFFFARFKHVYNLHSLNQIKFYNFIKCGQFYVEHFDFSLILIDIKNKAFTGLFGKKKKK